VFGPYVHAIDPIVADVGGLHLWWYGLGFALGFLEIHLFLGRGRAGLRHSWLYPQIDTAAPSQRPSQGVPPPRHEP
jgi:prolipoprotein diacylglyceryltransferase